MADARLTPETNGIRYGLYTAVGMIIYFIAASLFKLTDRIEFSFLNGVVLAIGICMAIANFKRYRQDKMPYLQGFGTGIITAMVGSLVFSLFFIVYAGILNPEIMKSIRTWDRLGFDLSVTIAFLAILLQGAMGGVIISLVAMQYYKSPDHKPITGIE
jgi:drug/metabolite transporter (DMT)-like permease